MKKFLVAFAAVALLSSAPMASAASCRGEPWTVANFVKGCAPAPAPQPGDGSERAFDNQIEKAEAEAAAAAEAAESSTSDGGYSEGGLSAE